MRIQSASMRSRPPLVRREVADAGAVSLDDRYARLVHDALEALDPYRIHRHTRPDQVTRWDGASSFGPARGVGAAGIEPSRLSKHRDPDSVED